MRFMDQVCTGPACRFGDAHIYYFLHTLNENGKMSRAKLSEVLNIGEGSTRGLIELLKEWKMLDVKQTGMSLSDYGREFLGNIPVDIVSAPRSEYVPGAFNSGVIVHGCINKVTDGMYQRDRAIIAGADGAGVFIMDDGELIMPKTWNIDQMDPEFAGKVRRITGIGDGDVLIITGASDPDVATVSAIAVGLDML